MKRLAQENLNTPVEYDVIYEIRSAQEPNWQDMRRWRTLVRYFKGGNLVDIGCLDSMIPYYLGNLAECKFNYLGTDVSKTAIKRMDIHRYQAHSGCDKKHIEYLLDDIYESQLQDEVADYVVMGEVLEHLEKPEEALKQAFRILKPGGIMAISVPLEEANEPGAVDLERHLWSYSEKDIKELVKPYSNKVETKVLKSRWFPKYQYCWPQLLCWATKS